MKRYLLSYLVTYFVSLAVTAGVFFIGLANWFFGPSPIWFDTLSAVVLLLIFLAAGWLLGHRAKRKGGTTPRQGFLLLAGLMVILAVLGILELNPVYLLSAPGMVIGNAVEVLFDLKYRWGYQTHLRIVWPLVSIMGAVVQAALFHLGWKTGQRDRK